MDGDSGIQTSINAVKAALEHTAEDVKTAKLISARVGYEVTVRTESYSPNVLAGLAIIKHEYSPIIAFICEHDIAEEASKILKECMKECLKTEVATWFQPRLTRMVVIPLNSLTQHKA